MNPNANRLLGTIRSFENGKWQIALANTEGCTVCQQGLCWDPGETKIVEVPKASESYSPGQKVWVEVTNKSGRHAITLFYGLPSILMITWLIVTLALGMNEGLAGVGSLLLLAPYYLILHMVRHHWKDKIHLELRPL